MILLTHYLHVMSALTSNNYKTGAPYEQPTRRGTGNRQPSG